MKKTFHKTLVVLFVFVLTFTLLPLFELPVAAASNSNHAPTVTNTSATIPAISEDVAEISNSGITVDSLLKSLAGASDADGDTLSIAVTSVDDSNGTWQLKYQNNWWNLTRYKTTANVSDSNVYLVPNGCSIRFMPGADFNGQAFFTFRVWDETFGTADNQNSDPAIDASGSNNGGSTAFSAGTVTASITVTSVNDKPEIHKYSLNNALKFDGVNDYVQVPDDLGLSNGSFTIEGWINAYSNPTYGRFFDFGSTDGERGGHNILVDFVDFNSDKNFDHLGFEIWNFSTRADSNIPGLRVEPTDLFPLNTWVYLTAVYDSTRQTAYMYWNGVLKASGTVPSTTQDLVRTYNYFGRSLWTGDQYFKGEMRNIAVWKEARTAGEVAQDMNASFSGSETNLVLYYPVNDAVGSATVKSATGNHNGNLMTYSLDSEGTENSAANNAMIINDNAFDYQVTGNAGANIPVDQMYLKDVDAGAAGVTLTLSTLTGTLSLNPINGVTLNGNNSKSMTASGTIDDLNSALKTLTYRSGTVCADTITAIVNDGGHTGFGGALTDTKQIGVTVSAVPANTPTITAQPSNKSVKLGASASFSATATGSPTLTYQWQKSTDGGSTWSSVGTNSQTYTISSTAKSDNGTQYRCYIYDTTYKTSATSDKATLTVAYPILKMANVSPANGSTGIAVDTQLAMPFNENMIKGTGKIHVVGPSGNDVCAVSVNDSSVIINNNMVTVALPVRLDYITKYHILIDDGAFVDTDGGTSDGLSDSSAWSFTTAPDLTAPSLGSFTPSNSSTNVTVDTQLTMTFSKNVLAATGNITVKKASDNSVAQMVHVADVSVSGSTVTVTLPGNLDYSTQYYVLIDSGAFTDTSASHNLYAGLSDKTWSFTTVAAPSLGSFTPSNGSTNVAVDTRLTMTFSKNVLAATGNIVVKKASNNTVAQTVPVADVSVSGSTVTITLPGNLDYSTQYYILIDSGAFTDTFVSHNPYAGLRDSSAWSFTTAASPEETSVETAEGLVSGATYTMTQAAAVDEDAVKAAIEAQIAALGLDGVTPEVTEVTYTPAIAGDAGTPAGTNGTYTFTVKLTKGGAATTTAVLTMTITATAYDPDKEAVEEAERAVSGATYTMTQAEAADEAAVKAVIEAKIASLGLDAVTAEVTEVTYTPATAGDAGTPAGINGSYTFTVGLTKGAATTTTSALIMTIVATAYDVATADAASVETAKDLVSGATYTMTQATAVDEDAVKAAIEAQIAALALDGVTPEVTEVTYTPATAGDAGTPAGINGSYTFTVGLTKGEAAATTGTLTMTITATSYDTEAADAASVETAKDLVSGATYTMTQAAAVDEDAVKAAIEARIAALALDGVTPEVTEVTYAPAVVGDAGTLAGTNGSYTFTVGLTKGAATTTTSALTMTITATPYDAAAADAASVAGAKADLDAASFTFASGDTASAITQIFTLPAAGSNGTIIAWTVTTDNGNNISISGSSVTVTRPTFEQGDKTVLLTATIIKNGASETKDIMVTVKRLPAPNNGDGGSTPVSPNQPANTGLDILVNGKTETAATATTMHEGDKTVTTVVVDDKKVEEKLQQEGRNALVTIPVNTGADVVVGTLNGQTVKNMENTEAVLEIKTGQVIYTLPASQINIDAVSEQIGKQVELKDIAVNVKISEPAVDTVKIVEDTANKNNYQIMVKPIEFEITCSSENKAVEVSKFNVYVERMIAIPEGVDPSRITTGIIQNPDGTFSHVPTVITMIDGKYYAKINSLTNSTYALIYSPKTFKDVENHWAKDAVNDMGSRLVIYSLGNGDFEPDSDLTRAEFAEIVVRALGLMHPGTGKDAFNDVAKGTYYYDAVSIASEYGLIYGYGNGKFGPDDKITREQAMAIVARAMKITGLKSELKDSEVSLILANYSDGAAASDYTKTDIAACVKSGIVLGRSKTTLAPKDNITRAEVAVIVRRLLQKSGLI